MATERNLDEQKPLPSPEIPWQWQIGWNRLSTPFAHMDTVHIGESLFVASCGPYVLDFGYYTNRGTWAYVLTVCDGAFCGQKPVVYGRFAARDPALVALTDCMAKLAADCDASGATLEKLTVGPTVGALTCHFNPPGGPRLLNPTSKYIWSLLVWQSPAYWLGQCGDASLRFTDQDGATVSELVFLLREPHGVYMLFLPNTGPSAIACRSHRATDADINVTHGGAPLNLPARMMITRADAAEIAKAYVDRATGERPPHALWE